MITLEEIHIHIESELQHKGGTDAVYSGRDRTLIFMPCRLAILRARF